MEKIPVWVWIILIALAFAIPSLIVLIIMYLLGAV